MRLRAACRSPRERRTATLPIAAVVALHFVAFLASCSDATAPSTFREYPAEFPLTGMAMAERLETLQVAGARSPVDVFYLGDPYRGMTMSHISVSLIGGGAYRLDVRYSTGNGDASVQLLEYGSGQSGESRVSMGGTLAKTVSVPAGRADIYEVSSAKTYMLVQGAETTVEAWGDPNLGVDELAEVAADLIPVPR